MFLYLDSELHKKGEIAHFFDEYMSSWTAWLGVVLVACLLVIEQAVINAFKMLHQGYSNESKRVSEVELQN